MTITSQLVATLNKIIILQQEAISILVEKAKKDEEEFDDITFEEEEPEPEPKPEPKGLRCKATDNNHEHCMSSVD